MIRIERHKTANFSDLQEAYNHVADRLSDTCRNGYVILSFQILRENTLMFVEFPYSLDFVVTYDIGETLG